MKKNIGFQIVAPANTEFRLITGYGENTQNYTTLDELLDALKIAHADWKRVEGRKKSSFKLSEIFNEVIYFIEKELMSDITEDNLKTRQELYTFFNQKNVYKQENFWSFIWQNVYSNSQPSINISPPMLSSVNGDNYKAGYDILRNSSIETYKEFLDLYRNSNQLISNLNSSNQLKIEASLAFLSTKVQNKAILGLNTNIDDKGADLVVKMSQFSSSIDSARVSFESETRKYLEIQEERFKKSENEHSNYVKDIENNLLNFITEKEEHVANLEDSYEQKLKLKAPIKFWEDEAKKYKKSAIYWSTGAVVSGLLIILTGLWILKIGEQDLDKLKNISIIPVYFVPIALISLLIYILRTLIKIAISNQHISVEYSQKAALTDYYLSMIQSGHLTASTEEKQLLLPTIFSKIDSGLIKADSSGDSDISELLKLLIAKK